MGKWLDDYDGTVKIRIPQFKVKPNNIDWEYRRRKLAAEFVKRHIKTSYPDLKTHAGRMKLYMAKIDLNLFGHDLFTYTGDDAGIFCTMLLVMDYQHCGHMSLDIDAKEFVPEDARDGGILETKLIDCAWSKEIQLK